MKTFTLPELYCPFSSQINKYYDVLKDYAIEWLLRFNLLTNESYRRFSESKFCLLAAGTYPYCEFEELKITNDLHSWLFIWDDQCDMSDLGKQPEDLKLFHQRFLEILNGVELTKEDIPLGFALSDLRRRMLQMGGEKWFNHFVRCFKDYFDGCVLQAEYRAKGIVPSVENYIKIRNLCSAVDSCLALIELCYRMEVAHSLRNHKFLKTLNLITNNIISWCNDIFSAPREIGSGDVHNLVYILHYHEQISMEQAMKRAAELHNQKVQELLDLEAFYMQSFGEKLDADIAKYTLGCHTWIRGNFDWYAHSGRYQDIEKLEIVKVLNDTKPSNKNIPSSVCELNLLKI